MRHPPGMEAEWKVEPAKEIILAWNKFNGFPMETLTKAWCYQRPAGPRQRTVEEMVAHRQQYGTGGNCFDLAIWLLHELKIADIPAHGVGHDFFTPEAHVAVVAYDDGRRYLCDLGDQWVLPIPIDDANEMTHPMTGFFPGAKVALHTADSHRVVTYHRPSGKISRQSVFAEENPR